LLRQRKNFLLSGGHQKEIEENLMKNKTIAGILALTMILTFLAGCSGQTDATPTTDPKMVYTQVAQQAAQTVAAQTTNAAKLTPKASNTPQPTDIPATPVNTATKPATTPGAGTPTVGTPAAGTPAATKPAATATSNGTAAAVPDKALYVSQTVADGTTIKQNTGFEMTWRIKNVGTTTWTSNYTIRLYAGNRLGVADFKLGKSVAPNATTDITVHMTAPTTSGTFVSYWVISNLDLVNFGQFTLEIKVP
jgi:hypothetical protein